MVGSVRSGTTLLRDILRSHPDFCCPEESHFFRWGDPFGTPAFENRLLRQAIFQKHRSLDGITEEEFAEILSSSKTRGDLWMRYMDMFSRKKCRDAKRWFDKSPQNIYGILLMNDAFPESKFVHTVRNPLNVVASLLTNETLPIRSVIGACNYWNEAITIVNAFKKIVPPSRLYELRYEELTNDPKDELKKLFDFLGEDPTQIGYRLSQVYPERDNYKEVLDEASMGILNTICGKWKRYYGY